jgi:hypothetical protein
MIHVNGDKVALDVYRDVHDDDYDYDDIIHKGILFDGSTLPATRISFQDGVSPDAGYFGTFDTILSQASPIKNFGTDVFCLVDEDDPPGSGNDLSAILYRDISTIAARNTVEEETISLNVFNTSNDTYHLFEMKQNRVENEANWNAHSGVNTWQTPGALGPLDSSNTVLGTFAPSRNPHTAASQR